MDCRWCAQLQIRPETYIHSRTLQVYQDGGYSQAELDALLATMEVQDLTPGMVFHVKPGYLHRVESVEDLLMVESSTVELDDVFRIHDDTNRPDGYIASEHNSN